MSSRLITSLLVFAASACQCGDVRLGTVLSRLEVDPASVDFGTVPIGQQKLESVTLTNPSAVAVTIDTLSISGDAAAWFSAIPSGGPFTIKGGASLGIDVLYAPTSEGAHAARLVIRSGASNAPELLIPLAGNTGVVPFDAGAGPGLDAGTVPDAGTVDAGSSVDAGTSVDAGIIDAGIIDAGIIDAGIIDAGTSVDAGPPLTELDAGPPCSVLGTCCPDGLFRQGTQCVGAGDLSTGSTHACAIVDGGTVKCWGEAASGQLGVGVFATHSVKPVTVPGLSATRIRAGERFTCALASGGTVWCWGDNASGQLGNGSTTTSPSPVQVSGLSGVTDLALGSGFACARLSTGTLQCWGRNDFGQLGLSGTYRTTPATVIASGVSRLSLGAGDGHTCATLTDGSTRCWGYNGWGQLGDGTTNSPRGPVAAVNAPAGGTITVGVSSGCAVNASGDGTCWGNNDHGQLGNGSRATAPPGVGVVGLTTPQSVLNGPWRALSATSRFHGCGVTTAGAARCWGKAPYIGDGSTSERLVPTDVLGLGANVRLVSLGGLALGLSGGLAFSCALLETGGVKCWGDNGLGQLGNGTSSFALSPQFVTDL